MDREGVQFAHEVEPCVGRLAGLAAGEHDDPCAHRVCGEIGVDALAVMGRDLLVHHHEAPSRPDAADRQQGRVARVEQVRRLDQVVLDPALVADPPRGAAVHAHSTVPHADRCASTSPAMARARARSWSR